MGKKANKKVEAKVIEVLEQALQTKGFGILKSIDALLLREQSLSKEIEEIKSKFVNKT